MSVHKKLMQARVELQGISLKKSGHNKFAGYKYFELSDFLVPALMIFNELKITPIISFGSDAATMTIINCEKPDERIVVNGLQRVRPGAIVKPEMVPMNAKPEQQAKS